MTTDFDFLHGSWDVQHDKLIDPFGPADGPVPVPGHPGVLDDPVRGSFADGVGEFVGPADHDGRRYLAIPLAGHRR